MAGENGEVSAETLESWAEQLLVEEQLKVMI